MTSKLCARLYFRPNPVTATFGYYFHECIYIVTFNQICKIFVQ